MPFSIENRVIFDSIRNESAILFGTPVFLPFRVVFRVAGGWFEGVVARLETGGSGRVASPEREDRAAANPTAVGSRRTRGVDCDFGFFAFARFTWAINSRSLDQPWADRKLAFCRNNWF